MAHSPVRAVVSSPDTRRIMPCASVPGAAKCSRNVCGPRRTTRQVSSRHTKRVVVVEVALLTYPELHVDGVPGADAEEGGVRVVEHGVEVVPDQQAQA